MTMESPRILRKERDGLGITAADLNELADPIDNILLDVMLESFYKRILNKRLISDDD